MKTVLNQNSFLLWMLLSLALHVAGLSWCPSPGSFSPPHPVYLVVDLFSGPAVSGMGQELDTASSSDGKSAPSATESKKGPPEATPAPKPPPTGEPAELQNPQLTKPASAEKISKQESVPPLPAAIKTPTKQSPEADARQNPSTAPVLAVTAEPFTGHQDNFGRGPAAAAGNGAGTGLGNETNSDPGTSRGHRGHSGSGSPVETPMAYGTNPPPPYPTTARRRGWEGEVLLLVDVTSLGEVCKVTVSRSSGYQILDRAALNAIYRWQFQAAQKNGRAVAGQVMVPIRFSIKDAQ